MFGTIGILTGGGDAPGLNAVIRAVVKTATCEYGMRVIGIEDGFEGLLGGKHVLVCFHPATCADCCRAAARFSARAIAGA